MTDDLVSCDPVTPPQGVPAHEPPHDAPRLFSYAWMNAGPQTAASRPGWIDTPDPTDPFAYRDLPDWATEPTSVHRLHDCGVPDPTPAADVAGRPEVPDRAESGPPFRDALTRLRDAGPGADAVAREAGTGWAAADAYAAAAADHAAGLPLPAVTAVRPPSPAAVLPSDAPPVPAAGPPPPPVADPSRLVGRHRVGEPPSRKPRFRGIAAVLPWNWRRR